MNTQTSKTMLPTAAGAIVMSFGIMALGALTKLGVLHKGLSITVVCLLVLMLAVLAIAYGRDTAAGRLAELHLKDPVKSFAAGTWVAAAAVTALTVHTLLPAAKGLALFLFGLACLLMLGYLVLILRNYGVLLRKEAKEQRAKVTGGLLLACVAAQSVASAGHAVLGPAFTSHVGKFLWAAGILLYAVGFLFIAYRYSRVPFRKWPEEWDSTNCIIHGAISITGLTGAMAKIASPGTLDFLWVTALLLFAAVEMVEVLRAVQRVRDKGWAQGLWVYQTTQWSRNFTFGMLLAFTMHLPSQGGVMPESALLFVRDLVLAAGPYAVILLFLLEASLAVRSVKSSSPAKRQSPQKSHSVNL